MIQLKSDLSRLQTALDKVAALYAKLPLETRKQLSKDKRALRDYVKGTLDLVINGKPLLDFVSLSVAIRKEPEAPRYHFTDKHPFVVRTATGDIKLGDGWLAIQEKQYHALNERPDITQRQYQALLRDRRELRDREDDARDNYLTKPYYGADDIERMLPIGTRRLK